MFWVGKTDMIEEQQKVRCIHSNGDWERYGNVSSKFHDLSWPRVFSDFWIVPITDTDSKTNIGWRNLLDTRIERFISLFVL